MLYAKWKKPHTRGYTELTSIYMILLKRQNYSDRKKCGFRDSEVGGRWRAKRELSEVTEMFRITIVMAVTQLYTFVQNSLTCTIKIAEFSVWKWCPNKTDFQKKELQDMLCSRIPPVLNKREKKVISSTQTYKHMYICTNILVFVTCLRKQIRDIFRINHH